MYSITRKLKLTFSLPLTTSVNQNQVHVPDAMNKNTTAASTTTTTPTGGAAPATGTNNKKKKMKHQLDVMLHREMKGMMKGVVRVERQKFAKERQLLVDGVSTLCVYFGSSIKFEKCQKLIVLSLFCFVYCHCVFVSVYFQSKLICLFVFSIINFLFLQ